MATRTNYESQSWLAVAGQQLLVLIVVMLVWTFVSGRFIPAFYISDPASIARVLVDWFTRGTIWIHLGSTTLTLFLGYLLGSTLGIAAGIALGIAPRAERVVAPFIAAVYGLPKVALLPLLVILFGIGLLSKVILVASVVFFLLFYATIGGMKDVDRDTVDSLRLMGATESEIVRKVRLPSILPWIYTGYRTSLGYALTTTVVSEALSSNRGLGFLIEHSAVQFNSAGVFAAVVVLLALSSVIMIPLGILENRLKPQNH